MQTDRKSHWETIYQTKQPNQVSWTQEVPKTSLEMIKDARLSKDAKIIDIGGGDSLLVDHFTYSTWDMKTFLCSTFQMQPLKERRHDWEKDKTK